MLPKNKYLGFFTLFVVISFLFVFAFCFQAYFERKLQMLFWKITLGKYVDLWKLKCFIKIFCRQVVDIFKTLLVSNEAVW